MEGIAGAARKLTVFVDSNVLLAWARGDRRAQRFFSSDGFRKIDWVVNPIVLQEVILSGELAGERREPLQALLHRFRMLPIRSETTDEAMALAPDVRSLRIHVNDALHLASAREADYVLSDDKSLRDVESPGPQVLGTAEFERVFEAA